MIISMSLLQNSIFRGPIQNRCANGRESKGEPCSILQEPPMNVKFRLALILSLALRQVARGSRGTSDAQSSTRDPVAPAVNRSTPARRRPRLQGKRPVGGARQGGAWLRRGAD